MSQEGGYHGALWLVTALSPGLECFPGVSQAMLAGGQAVSVHTSLRVVKGEKNIC